MKKTLLAVLVPVFCVLMVTGCGKKENNNTPANEGGKVDPNTIVHTIDEQTIEGLTFTDAVVEFKNNESTFNVKVSNNTESPIAVNQIIMHLKDKDNNELAYLVGTIADTIQPGENRTIGSSYAGDFSEAIHVDYEVIKG